MTGVFCGNFALRGKANPSNYRRKFPGGKPITTYRGVRGEGVFALVRALCMREMAFSLGSMSCFFCCWVFPVKNKDSHIIAVNETECEQMVKFAH